MSEPVEMQVHDLQKRLDKIVKERDDALEHVERLQYCQRSLSKQVIAAIKDQTLFFEQKEECDALRATIKTLVEALEHARWEIQAISGALPTIDEALASVKGGE